MPLNNGTEPITHLPILKAVDLEVQPRGSQWLVRDVWARNGVGVIGGPPKACKSFFALDLAVSVASGSPCLDNFAVDESGPALVYFAEDAQPIVRTRLEALCRHRDLDVAQLDLHVITASSLRIDLDADRRGLIEAIERTKPCLLLLDPFIRLHRLCENDAREMSGLLGFLRDLQRRYDLAIALVHHASKRYRSQPGFGLRGSGDIYAVGDSNAYLARREEGKLLLTLEHRAAPPMNPLVLKLAATENPPLQIQKGPAAEQVGTVPTIYEAITNLLDNETKPLTRTTIRTSLKVNNKRLGDALAVLEKQGIIVRQAKGWLQQREGQGHLAF